MRKGIKVTLQKQEQGNLSLKNFWMLAVYIQLKLGGIKMSNRDGKGPRSGSRGPRDGRGQGRGRASGKGIGRKKGGRKGNC